MAEGFERRLVREKFELHHPGKVVRLHVRLCGPPVRGFLPEGKGCHVLLYNKALADDFPQDLWSSEISHVESVGPWSVFGVDNAVGDRPREGEGVDIFGLRSAAGRWGRDIHGVLFARCFVWIEFWIFCLASDNHLSGARGLVCLKVGGGEVARIAGCCHAL